LKRYKIDVFEEIPFTHEVVFESDAVDIDKILDEAQKGHCLDDVIYSLKNQGCNIKEVDRDNDGDFGTVEIEDCLEVKEEREN
jgi:hypothetical protein